LILVKSGGRSQMTNRLMVGIEFLGAVLRYPAVNYSMRRLASDLRLASALRASHIMYTFLI
jgi:hypothetical protein